jgi:hypothetical protein
VVGSLFNAEETFNSSGVGEVFIGYKEHWNQRRELEIQSQQDRANIVILGSKLILVKISSFSFPKGGYACSV